MQKLLRYSGVAGIAVLWLSVGTSLLVTKFNILGTLPISYLGVYEDSKYIFNTGLIISASLLLAFLYILHKQISLSKLCKISFIMGQLFQITVALTPYNSQTIIRPIHVISAFSLAITLPLSMLTFQNSIGVVGRIKRITSNMFKLELLMFVLGIGWFVSISSAGALSEIVVAVVYDIWILRLSLLLIRLSKSPHV